MEFKNLKNYFSDLKIEDKNLKRDICWLIENVHEPLSKTEQKILLKNIKKLQKGVPLAYVLGFVPFLDCKIFVNKHTLIPRPETELLVDMLIKQTNLNQKNISILDLCSGSGCIGIALKKHLNESQVTLCEINKKCIQTIQKNANENNVFISVLRSDMFKNINSHFDMIVSNPPYIKTNDIKLLDKSVKKFEPNLALDGGNDGLKFYRIIAKNATNYLNDNGILALEIGFSQAKEIKKLLKDNFKNINIIKDYSKKDRFIIATRR